MGGSIQNRGYKSIKIDVFRGFLSIHSEKSLSIKIIKKILIRDATALFMFFSFLIGDLHRVRVNS
jgi:hypothetical protein